MPSLFKKLMFETLCYVLLPSLIFAAGAEASAFANDDLIIILDQSLSMKEKVPGSPNSGYEKSSLSAPKSRGAVEAINFVVDAMLRHGDYFALLTFGERSYRILAQQLLYKHERELIRHKLGKLNFEDKKTDIVAGIKEGSLLVEALHRPLRRKMIVVITDGTNDPPSDSPYATPSAQKAVYEKLRGKIKSEKWNVVLVGIGDYTADNIRGIARNLGLPDDKAIIIGQPRNSQEIREKLKSIFTQQRDARVEMKQKEIRLRLSPGLFGGYGSGETSLPLMSFFADNVEISLDPKYPVRVGKRDDLQFSVNPLNLTLGPQQLGKLKVSVSFKGKRPAEGRIVGNFAFQFAETSTPFYPHDGQIEIILPSWWEVFGLYAIFLVIFMTVLAAFVLRTIRKIQVPEIRIAVTANGKSLGEAMTLRTGESFSIANRYFEGVSVSAKGLSCKIAATVKYLGRRKFEIEGAEAVIIEEGKEKDRLKAGMNSFFDLRDKEGNTLRSIMIGEPGAAGDPFGDDSDPF